jgi:hypothetical protein
MSTKIPSTVRNSVWNIYIGKHNKTGLCLCCGTEDISYANFHCGHIVSKCNGGKVHMKNLRPICGQCNSSMGKMNMLDFMNKYGFDKQDSRDELKSESKLNISSEKEYKISKTNDNDETSDFDNIIQTHKQGKGGKRKMIRVPFKHKTNDKEYINYLSKFIVTELQLICIYFNISKYGIKNKIIDKIITSDKNITKQQIKDIINKHQYKRYYIECFGDKSCNKVILGDEDDMSYCD